MVESWLGGSQPSRPSVRSYADEEEEEGGHHVLCARCYSLRHYGWVWVLSGAGRKARAGRG